MNKQEIIKLVGAKLNNIINEEKEKWMANEKKAQEKNLKDVIDDATVKEMLALEKEFKDKFEKLNRDMRAMGFQLYGQMPLFGRMDYNEVTCTYDRRTYYNALAPRYPGQKGDRYARLHCQDTLSLLVNGEKCDNERIKKASKIGLRLIFEKDMDALKEFLEL